MSGPAGGGYRRIMASRCADCPMRLRADRKPDSLITKIWRWHTTWCPGWKAYQEELRQQAG